MKKFKILMELFLTFFKIGAFTFGGGLAMIPLIENQFVIKKKYLEHEELLNIIAVSQSTPGPIAINCATYIGYKKGGFLGSLFATLGVVIPSFIIIYVISLFLSNLLEYKIVANAFLGIQAAVAILIIQAAFKMIKHIEKNILSFIILILSCVFTIIINVYSLNFSTIYLIIIGGIIGFFVYTFNKKKQKKGDNK
jgi:chromate transporter